jgi:dissimilatory sulfite reductase (desulfoviridin) alpha/beta subunit
VSKFVWAVLDIREWKPARMINYVAQDVYEVLNNCYAEWCENEEIDYEIDSDGFEEFNELVDGDPETEDYIFIADLWAAQKFEVL